MVAVWIGLDRSVGLPFRAFTHGRAEYPTGDSLDSMNLGSPEGFHTRQGGMPDP